jgi:hypothetical protein
MLQQKRKLFILLTIYYGVFILVLVGIANFAPDWLEYLPVGRLNELMSGTNFNSIEDEILSSYVPINTFQGAIQLVTALTGVILIMIPVRWVYFGADFGKQQSSIAANLILLPIVVTGIVAIVQNSLALAFSLAGIVAGVGYRTRLKDSADALFIFAAIGVGLAAGTLSIGIGLVMAIFFSFTVLIIPPPKNEQISLSE